jgi:hypothetical protein
MNVFLLGFVLLVSAAVGLTVLLAGRYRPLGVAGLLTLLGPGAGQLYNREYKKGAVLLGASLLIGLPVFAILVYSLARAAPPDSLATGLTPTEVQAFVYVVFQKNAGLLATSQWILLPLWLYSGADALWVAWKRLPPAQ